MMFLSSIQSFYSLYVDKWPGVLTTQLELSVNSPEHPIHHPEKYLDAHIDEVLRRALSRNEKELHFSAILHDITKSGWCPSLWEGRVGKLKTIPEGVYWQNVDHPRQALDFICLSEVNEWLVYHQIDIKLLKIIVGQHMMMKNYIAGLNGNPGGMGNVKRDAFRNKYDNTTWELMWFFSTVCDNMKESFSYIK